MSVFKIIPTTQKYDWGKKGLESKVAQFAAAANVPGFTLEHDAPYAELWMGTHPSSPARLQSGEPLSEHLAKHTELIGERVLKRFENEGARSGNLPFLLKILAIAKALSIQTHPDKAMAERLHNERPDVYKDANHKPEMALALTDFTAMCGFLPLPKIASYLHSTPEFAALIPPVIAERFVALVTSPTPTVAAEKAALRDLFAAVMTADEARFKAKLNELVRRYEQGRSLDAEKDVKDLVLTLHAQFPGDIGVFCAFILNYLKLSPGDAIFLAAGEPHAYVSGDIVECMATSDNVIRAGLTPKLRDVPNLVDGLTYTAAHPSKHLVQPTPFARPSQSSQYTQLYDPPIPEFAVLRVALPPQAKETHAPIDGPSVAIVTEGKGNVNWEGGSLEVSEGEVFFVGAGTEVYYEENRGKGLAVYRAFVEA